MYVSKEAGEFATKPCHHARDPRIGNITAFVLGNSWDTYFGAPGDNNARINKIATPAPYAGNLAARLPAFAKPRANPIAPPSRVPNTSQATTGLTIPVV